MAADSAASLLCSPPSSPVLLLSFSSPSLLGGMPSSHSATVMALATAIGLQEGAGGSAFAISAVLACVLLNQIVCELPPEHPVANVRPLSDSLGHTPLQVAAGALLGCVVGFLLRSST